MTRRRRRSMSAAAFGGTKATKAKPTKAKRAASGCELILCEDPKTGAIVTRSTGPCPPGYVERIAGRVAADGIRFRLGGGGDE